ncbi:MAG: hypothetical protein SCALA702_37100 [Melioribacteraceae bacterium]|nr:MAG: hypothetical protein SCALA702_37100 [Melioribacteraceae bacterium]
MEIFYTALLTFLINIPFGYLRKYTRKFTFCWFLTIHIPVPFVIWFRDIFNVELTLGIAPILFATFFLGQYTGKKLNGFKLAEENGKFQFFECALQKLRS